MHSMLAVSGQKSHLEVFMYPNLCWWAGDGITGIQNFCKSAAMLLTNREGTALL